MLAELGRIMNHEGIVMVAYGLAFLAMASAIAAQPTKGSDLPLARILWLFVGYGLVHVPADFAQAWGITVGAMPRVLPMVVGLHLVSYLLLFEFGRRLVALSGRHIPAWILPLLAAATGFASILSRDPWTTLDALMGYVMRFPAGLMITFGFWSYWRAARGTIVSSAADRYFKAATGASSVWAVACGLVRPEASFFPATVINIDTFAAATGVSIYLVRSAMILIVAWAVVGIHRVFNRETNERLKQAQADAGGELAARALAELTARHSAAHLNCILDSSLDIVMTVRKDGRIAYANSRVEALTGHRPADVVGRSFMDFIPGRLRGFMVQKWQEINEGVAGTYETQVLRADGTVMDCVVSHSVLEGFDEFVAVIEDVSQRKRQEVALRESEAWFRSAFEHSPVGLCVVGLGGRFMGAGRSLCAMLGYEERELLGMALRDVTHPDDVASGEEARGRLLRGELDSVELEERFIRKDGGTRWALVNACLVRGVADRPSYFLTHMLDITQRKDAEEALRRSEEHYRTMIEHSNDLIWMLDVEGRFTYFNAIAEQVTGHKLEDWVGKKSTAPLAPESKAVAAEAFRRTLAGEAQQYEVEVLRADASTCVLSVQSAPVFDAGRVVGTVSFGRDITERRQLEQLQSDFVSMISHELRTPLNAILGYGTLLKRIESHDSEEARATRRRALERQAVRAREMTRLVEDLLNASRIESGGFALDRQPIDLRDVVARCISGLDVDERHVVRMRLPAAPAIVDADPDRLSYALSNLMKNAVKFSPDGGEVLVRVSRGKRGAQVSVKDHGVGIRPGDLPSIFDRFSQADMSSTRHFGGFGLGLFVARTIVEAHDGSIRATSRHGAGATFTVVLPYARKGKRDGAAPGGASRMRAPRREIEPERARSR